MPLLFLSTAGPVKAGTVFPDFGGVGGSGDLRLVVGALLTFLLITAVLMMLICAATWAVANASGNTQAASKAKTGAWAAVGTAVLAGAGTAWVNFLIGIGTQL